MKERFEVMFLGEAIDFMEKLEYKAKEKIYYNIRKSQFVNDEELFKKLNDEIWEFRTLYRKQAYRLFAFFVSVKDKKTLIFISHGIIKKSQKTPSKEIYKAVKIRMEYLNQKDEKDN